MLKREWWQYYKRSDYDTGKLEFDELIMSVDAAFKDNDDNDYVAIEVWGKKKAAMILESYAQQMGMRRVLVFLQNYGISPNLAMRIAKYYGENTVELVRENPYRMVMDIDGVGFLTADRIALSMGMDPQSEFRIRAEKAEAITHCNEQLEALAKTAKLRDRQVETLSRLWAAKTDDERSLFGTVFTRQLYRVFADHGIDVEHDMPAYPANVGALITPAEMPVTDRIIREYNHLREHAELVLQADMRNRGRFLGDGLRSALAGLRDAVNNGAPEPTPDIADCA